MTDTPEAVRKGLLPCIPPPEWEFHTILGARTDSEGCALFPGDRGPTVVRRRVSYGDWEPVRPDRWAEEPQSNVRLAGAVVPSVPADQTAGFVLWLDASDGSVPTHDGIVWPDGTATVHHRHFGHTTTHPDPETACRSAHGKQGRIVWPEPAATDRTELRDRIAALFRCPPGAERLGDATPGEIADAVLAVLPATTDRAAEVEGMRAELAKLIGWHREDGDALGEMRGTIERLRERYKASLRHADKVNNELMEEVQRYAAGTERPVLWSVYNDMHQRALKAEAASGPGRVADETQQPVDAEVVDAHDLALSFTLDGGETQQPTPCDQPNPCEDGELCGTHEEEQAHAEGEHEYCGVTCEVAMPSEPMRNFIIAKGYPGTKGALAELLRRAASGQLPAAVAQQQETHVVADDSDAPEHVDDCPGCEAFTLTGHIAETQQPETQAQRCGHNDIAWGLCTLPSGHDGDCLHEHQPRCGAWGGCTLRSGHNIGQADIPENHHTPAAVVLPAKEA